jgi:hypothetical protein
MNAPPSRCEGEQLGALFFFPSKLRAIALAAEVKTFNANLPPSQREGVLFRGRHAGRPVTEGIT